MKIRYLAIIAAIAVAFPVSGAGIDPSTYNDLVATIKDAAPPARITTEAGHFIVFTATGSARYAAIAFAHEQYKTQHPFKRLVHRDENGKKIDDVLFYIAEVPPESRELQYRMSIDGLWTVDPLNRQTEYDYQNGMMVSTLPVDYYDVFKTASEPEGQVRFTYEGASGDEIRLAGSFNGWDPFMYEMTETSPGRYEITLPLPPGTWYYAFFSGTTQLPDLTNETRVYTKDGRVASVVSVK